MRKKAQKPAGARKANRRSRIEADAFLAAIVESSDEAIISEDLQGMITSWNKAAERLFGYRAEAIIGKSVAAIFPPDRSGKSFARR